MLKRDWCNNGVCADCTVRCRLDETIPCSPDCENLTADGKILLRKCVKSKCDCVYSVFHEPDTMSLEDILAFYGDTPDYPEL